MDAVDEAVDASRCGGEQNCHGETQCLTHDLWDELSHQISSFLDGISLGDLVQKYENKKNKPKEHVIVEMTQQRV